MATERAVLAGGCFWGMQDLIRKQPGVISTRVGYTGGKVKNATYRNHDGHAEAIEITFDPAKTDYRTLLEFFFQIHDPTTLNRQGWDLGNQYRSAIFFTDPAQAAAARASLLKRQETRRKPIVTEITPASAFYPAENYHQQYLEKRGQASCHVGLKSDQPVIDVEPKVQGGTSLWQKLLKTGSSKT